jgi:putative sterol carrier protein
MAQHAEARSPAYTALEAITRRLAAGQARKPGAIQFRLTGEESGELAVEVDSRRQVKLIEGASERQPQSLVTGDGKRIRMVLEGKQDAASAFLAGGIQFRGDIRYLERLLQELELVKPRRGREG